MIDFNKTFVTNIKEIYGNEGNIWLNNLEEILNTLCAKWNLNFITVMPNLTYHFVCLVKQLATHELAVLKVGLEEKRIIHEVRCLECFTSGVPKIYVYDKENHAILMEYLEPGYSLKSIVKSNDDLATQIICEEIKKLQANQKREFEFKHISELDHSLSKLDGHVDIKLLEKAKRLFTDLTIDRKNDVILHGDLHHDNILACGDSWKAIDPHGYIGDPAFEVGSVIFNPYDSFPTHLPLEKIIKRRLEIMVANLPFDKHRIKAWTFCKTVLSVAWTFEDHGKIDHDEFEIARIVDSIKL